MHHNPSSEYFSSCPSAPAVNLLTHELEHEVEVPVVGGLVEVEQGDDVGVSPEGPQVDDLAVRPLCVGAVLERVEDLLHRDSLLCVAVERLPHDAVSLQPLFAQLKAKIFGKYTVFRTMRGSTRHTTRRER